MEDLMSFQKLREVLGARLFAGEGKQAAEFRREGFSSVSVDSRELLPGALFVALRGAVQDGHAFVEKAFRDGASGALVALSALENPKLGLLSLAEKFNRVLVAVDDTLKGLQNAAAFYLRQFPDLIRIGITGSMGKTTTKEIAAAIIGQEKAVVMNKGNLNSETGLPISVFEVRAHHEVGIFEAGMNRPGEISALAKILDPNLAVITNIGSAHIGILGSRDKIAEEKKKIFSEFNGTNTALIPVDDDYRDFLARDVNGKVVFYGASTLPAFGGVKDLGLEGTEIIWDGTPVRFGLPGRVNVTNAIAAAALALELPVSSSAIARGFASVKPIFGRGEIINGRSTLIRDCYNSNPESIDAALDFCDNLEWPGRKVYVLGAMLELGDISEKAHLDLGRRLASCRADMLFLLGDELRVAAEALAEENQHDREKGRRGSLNFFHTSSKNELSRALDNYIVNGDLVLLKGSRCYEMEELTAVLTGQTEKNQGAMHVS